MFQQDILCALSGGGFRATFFHVGVLRRLVAMGLKDNIKVISSVSGGSITSALFGLHYDEIKSLEDFDRLVLNPLKDFCKKNPRNKLVKHHLFATFINAMGKFGALLGPIGVPLSVLVAKQTSDLFIEQLDKHLFEQKTLADLSKNLRVVLNATNLTNGARFRFDNTDFGDYKIGYSYEIANIHLSKAVAASACFPLLFSPIKFSLKEYEFVLRDRYKNDVTSKNTVPDHVYLSDGGLFDNLGYKSIEKEVELRKDGFVVISDAANRFLTKNKEFSLLNSPLRIVDILMEQVANRDRDKIMGNLINSVWSGINIKLEKPCRWYRDFNKENCSHHKEIPVVGWSDSIVGLIAKIRTDLNEFSDYEISTLVHHGESLIETIVARWHYPIYSAIQANASYRPLSASPNTEKDVLEALKDSDKLL